MSIKHDHTLNPVTALEFYPFHSASEILILAGEGCYLKIFDAKTSTLLRQLKAFEDQAIHGISVRKIGPPDNVDDDVDIAIWGGPRLAFYTRKAFIDLLASPSSLSEQPKDTDTGYYSANAPDWILNGLISSHGQCYFVTAHNTVLRATISKGSLILETLESPSRCILYSAHLAFESMNSVLVAAGTVFGEIIVWRCLHTNVTSESIVLHTFKGHEGSIFGVNISDVVYNWEGKSKRLLASCSDDRTIRIWEMNLEGFFDGSLSTPVAGIETGFGDKGEQNEPYEKTLAVVMGHASRIWSVQFLFTGLDVGVLSFGEDATTQYWQLENSGYSALKEDLQSPPAGAKLTHRDTFAFNTGKHIWSKAISSSSIGSAKVVTGGADGKISLFKTTAFEASHSHSWDLQDLIQGLYQPQINKQCLSTKLSFDEAQSKHIELPNNTRPSKRPDPPPTDKSTKQPKRTPQKAPKDAFNKYAFISEDRVLVTTTFGRVLIGEIDKCIIWTEVDMPAGSNDLRSYSIVKSIRELGIAFLGSANGTIFQYHLGAIKKLGRVQGKVTDMFGMSSANKSTELLATTLGGTHATIFKFSVHEQDLGHEIRKLKLMDKFIVTSSSKIAGRVVLGSRFGAVSAYNPENSEGFACTWSPTTIGDAVTSIVNLPHLSHSGYFLTTCRNGTYSIFSLADSLSVVHQGTPPFGPMIEAAWFSGTDLLMYGFKSKNFIVWNETQQYEVASFDCGGAHRSYAYAPVTDNEGAGHFVYTKTSRSYLHSQSKPSHRIIKSGGHGREIKACAVSPDGLIATGAEDTAIRIWRYHDGSTAVEKHFDCLAVMYKHTTGIQHLQWHRSSYLLSSGGNEEFFIWAVVEIPGLGIGMACEASNPDKSEEQDLRIMSFDVSSLSIADDGSETLVISLAYSDSTIRCYTYSKAEKFRLMAKGQYKSLCLTQLHHLSVGKELSFLTAGTDGYLTVWNVALPILSNCTGVGEDERRVTKLGMISNHRLHQSSIKALDIVSTDNRIIVATGGDDNALAVTVYNANDLQRHPRSVIVRSAHAAAITGLSFVSKASSNTSEEMRIVTSSNDQRVKEWAVRMSDESVDQSDKLHGEVHLRKVGDVFTFVADVGDVAALETEGEGSKVLIVGNGMEVYDLL